MCMHDARQCLEFLIQLGDHPHEKQICPSNSTSNMLGPSGKIVLVLEQIPRSERGSIKSNIFLCMLPFNQNMEAVKSLAR